jgi:hypothetical protein
MILTDTSVNPPRNYSFEGIPDESFDYLRKLMHAPQVRLEVDSERLRASRLGAIVQFGDTLEALARDLGDVDGKWREALGAAHSALVSTLADSCE